MISNMRSFNSPAWSHRWRAWWLRRHRATDTLSLHQRNVYILPTGAGWMFVVTLLVILVGSINFQLNLGFALTFLLAGSGLVSMHMTHATLCGLMLSLRSPTGVFCGSFTVLDIRLNHASTDKKRFGIGIRMAGASKDTMAWVDLAFDASTAAQASFIAQPRGLQAIEPLSIETRFPFGLFRAWSIWRPSTRIMVYPAPEQFAPTLPWTQISRDNGRSQHKSPQGDAQNVREYRLGDPMRQVIWKKSARRIESGGNLISRDTSSETSPMLWLDWEQCPGLGIEKCLSRLTAWVIQAHQWGGVYGLRLPGLELKPDQGAAHRQKCLESLALWGHR
jgi:uncharacterized protein (DUF58 family)